jgi:adenylosuccinate lyase
MNHSEYQSPYSWRYASKEMKEVWSLAQTRLSWRKNWVVLATVQSEYGLVTKDQVDELSSQAPNVNIQRSLEIEAEIHHDLMAEIKMFAEQCPLAGGIIHLGATSMDIEDNATALQLKLANSIIISKLSQLLILFADKIEKYAGLVVMGHTHIQPAEPTTLGYRFAFYAQDLFYDLKQLKNYQVLGKGFKGAVGTGASYGELIGVDELENFELKLESLLGIKFFDITNQVSPRRQEFQILSILASIGSTLHKIAFDQRILQSPTYGELAEPFGKKQVGSSAMPFKKNPITAEKINSLARSLAQFPRVAWDNAANSLLERTLDDSANRRSLLAEAYLILDELLIASHRTLKNLIVNTEAINRNLAVYGPFSATESIMMAAVKNGGNRQKLHEILRNYSLESWDVIKNGGDNPLPNILTSSTILREYLSKEEIESKLDVRSHVGFAEKKSIALSKSIRAEIKS